MSAWVCAGCTTVYSVGAPRCPHCSGTDHHEEGEAPAEAPVVFARAGVATGTGSAGDSNQGRTD